MVAPWDRRSRSEQERVETLLLDTWLPQATSYAPHWTAVVEGLGLEPADLGDRRGLARIPPSRQADVAEAGGAGAPGLAMRPTEAQLKARGDRSTLVRIARALRSDGAGAKRRAILEEFKPVQVHRGGVDDQLAVASSRSDLDRMHRVGARAAGVLGLDDHDYLVSLMPPGPRLGFWGVHHLALGSSILALHPVEGDAEATDVAAAFALVPATAVAVPLEEAAAAAGSVTAAGADVARVHTLVTVGPPPDDEQRAAIAEAWRTAGASWDLRVRAVWGPSEGRALWAECRDGTTGLYTYPDLEVLEVVDPITAEPTDGDGDLTLTTAGWHGTALLRYRTGAWVEGLDRDPCSACGRTVPRVPAGVVPEAWQPELTVGARRLRPDLRGVAAELAATRGATTWRTELRGPGSGSGDDELVVELAGDVPEQEQQVLADRIERSSGLRPAVVRVLADAEEVDRAAVEHGSVFVDLR